jgi:hypothetical protein
VLAGAGRRAAVAASGFSIYDPLVPDREDLFYPREELEALLCEHLRGRRVPGENRTKAKLAKQFVAEALGYPVPASFQRTSPRFTGQDLDVFAQASDNVQIYNQDLDPTRPYAILKLDNDAQIVSVRVVDGAALALLDVDGTITSKFQARRKSGRIGSRLVSQLDSELFRELAEPVDDLSPAELAALDPLDPPERARVFTIEALYERLQRLIGMPVEHLPLGERTRAQWFHELVCKTLGLQGHADSGQFPDISCQALEVKLQYRQTIDLGLVLPTSEGGSRFLGQGLRHCDARYLVAYTEIGPEEHYISALVLSTGEDFFLEFDPMGGLGRNDKLQIHLPHHFFTESECPPN